MRQKLAELVRDLADNRIGVARPLPLIFRRRHDSRDWFEMLHELLGAPWPCAESEPLRELAGEIGELLTASGVGTGRPASGWYLDAEVSLCGAMWCVVRHRRPEKVIETGVAHGVTSRVILESLRRNDQGRLWTIDLRRPLERQLHAATGVAVPDDLRDRWTYLDGSSQQWRGQLAAGLGWVDLFVFDSLYTARNTVIELERADAALASRGVMLVGDIKSHNGFAEFARRNPHYRTLVCESEDKAGAFGIAVKDGR